MTDCKKKILLLSGSPRKEGNTARILIMIQKCLEDIAETEICYLSDYNINGCLGCSACQKVFMGRHVALFKFIAGVDKAVEEMDVHSFIGGKHVGLLVSCQGPEKTIRNW